MNPSEIKSTKSPSSSNIKMINQLSKLPESTIKITNNNVEFRTNNSTFQFIEPPKYKYIPKPLHKANIPISISTLQNMDEYEDFTHCL
jgi:hypothetical protein